MRRVRGSLLSDARDALEQEIVVVSALLAFFKVVKGVAA
jgi:hypothetical protein